MVYFQWRQINKIHLPIKGSCWKTHLALDSSIGSQVSLNCLSDYLVGHGLGRVGDDLRLDVDGGGDRIGDGRGGGIGQSRGGGVGQSRGTIGQRIVEARVDQGRVGGGHQRQQSDEHLQGRGTLVCLLALGTSKKYP